MTEDFAEFQSQHSQQADTASPRVWTVFTAVVLALFMAVFFQAILGVVIALIEFSRGAPANELEQAITSKLASPYFFLIMVAAGQIGFALAGFIPAFLSKTAFSQRVGFRNALPSWKIYPLSMLGSIAPLAIGLAAAEALAKVIPADESLLAFFDALTIESAIVFVLFIGIVPGLVEEVLFRGYMQQRLVKRWGAVAGITITSILFALLHISPHAIVAVIPIGFWFGYIAWRSDSIWPTVMCHFFVNSGLNAWRMVVKFAEPSETFQNIFHVAMLIVGVICLVICFLPSFWKNERNSTASE